mgnify:CR=1 FL=1
MKLRKEFITHDTSSESLLVPAGGADFSGLVRGNKTFGEILELLKMDTDEAGIVAALSARYPGAEEIIRKDVDRALSELCRIHALDE